MIVHTNFGYTVTEREQAFISLYQRAFPPTAKYVSKMGGSFDEAKDIFQDALVIYYEKTIHNEIDLHVNEQAYLLGIAKHLWAKKFRENNRLAVFDDHFDREEETDEHLSESRLLHYLETAGQKCMELLRAFYYDNLPLNKIAGLFGFSGDRSATVQKYKCMEKVREIVKQKHLAYEDFIE